VLRSCRRLGGREDALEVARLDFEPWQGHRDLAIALEKPASVEDRDSDELAVSVPAEVVPSVDSSKSTAVFGSPTWR